MKEEIRKKIEKAIEKLYPEHKDVDIKVDYPPAGVDADFSSPVSSVLGKRLDKKPMEVAESLAKEVGAVPVEPVFLNFHIEPEDWIKELEIILQEGERYGSGEKGQKINLESVSANPTGPLTVGHGRGAIIGLVLTNVLKHLGHKVTRDYYYNDGGLQMKKLGESIRLRIQELKGEKIEFPEDLYQGEYIRDIAKQYIDSGEKGEEWQFAAKIIFDDIKNTLSKLGIDFDHYFNELSLFDKKQKNNVWAVLEALKEKGVVFEKDGATWLKSPSGEDRVLVRSTGEPTYRLPDIAYHIYKLNEKYDKIINILGSDHIAQFPDIKFAVETLGYDGSRINVIINQFVTLAGGKKMSTRKATYVTLDELIDEAGADVTKFFMIMSSSSSHMTFDLDLAKDTSEKNPVFRVQYAHARINSILKKAPSLNASLRTRRAGWGGEELALIRELAKFPETLREIAENYSVHYLPHYLLGLADAFHGFYEKVKVITDDAKTTASRLALVKAVQTVIGTGLRLMGIEPMEKM